jgi:carboxyl-terminal processing protease
MPDIFIPIDTTSYSEYFNDLIRQGVINSYILNFIDDNREKLKENYPTVKSFIQNFQITDEMMNSLGKMAEDKNIQKTKSDTTDSTGEIKTQLKALIARDLWDMTEYFQIINEQDKGFNKAREVLNNWEEYKKKYLEK